jgi:hypothetical protein
MTTDDELARLLEDDCVDLVSLLETMRATHGVMLIGVKNGWICRLYADYELAADREEFIGDTEIIGDTNMDDARIACVWAMARAGIDHPFLRAHPISV